MRRHKKLHTRLFRKAYRHRPNQRMQYLKGRKKKRAKAIKRALKKRALNQRSIED